MALNAYIPQDTGNLKYVAEAEDAGPDDLPAFVELLQEQLTGKSKDGPFVVLDIDAGFSAYVEFDEEEVTTVTRVLKIGGVVVSGSNGNEPEAAPAPKRAPAKRATGTRKAPVKKAAPKAAKAGTTKRTVKKAAPKAAPKKAPAAKGAAKTIRRGSGFKRNPGSAE